MTDRIRVAIDHLTRVLKDGQHVIVTEKHRTRSGRRVLTFARVTETLTVVTISEDIAAALGYAYDASHDAIVTTDFPKLVLLRLSQQLFGPAGRLNAIWL